MASFAADYFDGRSSRRHPVAVEVEGEAVHVRGEGVALDLALAQLAPQPHIGRMPLRIALPDGAVLVARAEDVRGIIAPPRAAGVAHLLETHLAAVVLAFIGLALAVFFGYRDGVPWLAREVAMRIPPRLEASIAEQALGQLDQWVLSPTRLEPAKRAEVERIFASLRSRAGPAADEARLEFRAAGMVGPNAFAIPGGVVVVTDALVELLGADRRLAAVLAHELGHLEHRHGSRQILQGSIVALVSMAVLGDVSAIAGLAATFPVALLNNGYSRDFEREADGYAFALLRKVDRSPADFADALEALERAHEERAARRPARPKGRLEIADEREGEAPQPEAPRRRRDMDYVATHPASAERIRAAREAAR